MLKYLMQRVFLWMVNYLNNKEILYKIDEIINKIEGSELYLKYLDLKEKIDNNKELVMLINEVKLLQKDVVHHLDKKELLNIKTDELNTYPLYREYLNVIYEINNTYAIIENDLNNYFYRNV